MKSLPQDNGKNKGKEKVQKERLHSKIYYGQLMHWSKELGRDVFMVWQELFCYVNRDGDWEPGDDEIIPLSLREVARRLDISHTQFQTRYIPILWDYGLIDFVDYGNSKNVIVYRVPLNRIGRGLEYQSIEKIRDYEKEYQSFGRSSGLKGGRPKKEEWFGNPNHDESEGKWFGKPNHDGSEIQTNMVRKTEPNNNINNNNIINKYDNHSEESRKIEIELEKEHHRKNELFKFVNGLNVGYEIQQALFNESYFYESENTLEAFRSLGKTIEKLCIQLSLKTREDGWMLRELVNVLIYDEFKDNNGNPIQNVYGYLLRCIKNYDSPIEYQKEEEKEEELDDDDWGEEYDLTPNYDW